MIQAFIYGNPRFLYDYFDDMEVILNLYDGDVVIQGRKKAEETLFLNALKEQEDKL